MNKHHPRCDMMEAASFGSMGNQCTCIECYEEDIAYLKKQLLAEQAYSEKLLHWVCHYGGMLNTWALEWRPIKDGTLTEFIERKLRAVLPHDYAALREHEAKVLEEIADRLDQEDRASRSCADWIRIHAKERRKV